MPLTEPEQGASTDTVMPLAAIAEVVGGPLLCNGVQTVTRRVRLLDTVDRRLLAQGRYLQVSPTVDGESWQLLDAAGRVRVEAAIAGPTPTYADDLPEGELRSALAGLSGIRALRPSPWITVVEHRSALRDSKGKIRCRLAMRSAEVEGGKERRSSIRVLGLRGYESDAGRIASRIRRHLGWRPDTPDPLVELADRVHPRPSGTEYPPVTDPGDPAGHALRPVLRALLDTIEQRSLGVIADIDSEELHDLRVAVRRSRSILTLLKEQDPELEFARGFFRWLGQVTGATRDLDVHILAWRAHRPAGGPDAGGELEPLGRYLAERRLTAQAALVRTLRSRRFRDSVRRWRRALDADGDVWQVSESMRRPVGDLAGARIRKLYRRALSEGAAITAASPAEALHALRKTMKKLRYVIEIAREVYPRGPVREVLRVVKELQQVLGDVQDMEVQADALRQFGEDLGGHAAAGPATLMAIGAWAEELGAARLRARDRFAAVFAPFARRRFGDRLLALTRNVPARRGA